MHTELCPQEEEHASFLLTRRINNVDRPQALHDSWHSQSLIVMNSLKKQPSYSATYLTGDGCGAFPAAATAIHLADAATATPHGHIDRIKSHNVSIAWFYLTFSY